MNKRVKEQFSAYIKSGNEDEKKQYLFKKKSVCQKLQIESLHNNKDIHLVVFAEMYCPDCAVFMPILQAIIEECENIIVEIYSRKSNRRLLENLTGNCKIPSVVRMDSKNKVVSKIIEMPETVYNRIRGDNKENVYSEYRKGLYDDLIVESIVKLIEKE